MYEVFTQEKLLGKNSEQKAIIKIITAIYFPINSDILFILSITTYLPQNFLSALKLALIITQSQIAKEDIRTKKIKSYKNFDSQYIKFKYH